MKKGIIFDFDQTLVDSSELEYWRANNNWKYVFANLNKIHLYDGISDLLQELRIHNIKIGVVSNSPSKYCKKVLELYNLNVDVIVGFHDSKYRKPHPDPVLKCILQLNVDSKDCLGVGDSLNDLQSYKAAGIFQLYAKWGGNDLNIDESEANNLYKPLEILNFID